MKSIQPSVVEENAGEDEQWMLIPDYLDDHNNYIVLTEGVPVITARPVMPLSVSSNTVAPNVGCVISGIPEDTQVRHPDGVVTVNDGTLEWSTPMPGQYQLRFENFPYHDVEVHIEVTS